MNPVLRTIRVVGAGAMGRGIAQVAASAGFDVEIADLSPAAVRSAVEFASAMLRRAAQKGQCSEEEAESAAARIGVVDAPDVPSDGVDLVIEAVVEDLAVKQELFQKLEVALPGAVLASNTSSLSITSVASALADPARAVGLHFFNPVPLMRLVEIIPGLRTAERHVHLCRGFVERIGHTAVVCVDSPGFVVNHVGRGLVTEALAILAERIADPIDIDRLARDCLGLRMGPFELMDLTGLDVTHATTKVVYDGFYAEPRVRPSPLAELRVAARLLGRKTDTGFYNYGGFHDYGVDGSQGRADDGVSPTPHALPLHVVDMPGLAQRLVGAGVEVVSSPSAHSVSLVRVVGEPAYRAAARANLDARMTLGVDPFTLDSGRLCAIATPQADPGATVLATSVLAAAMPVTVTADGPAPVVQRLAVAIVNLGCAVAERGIAAPGDIDRAVRLALGYPSGPLELGEKLGARPILAILEGLQLFTGDPRYRPTGWLRMHAECGLPLTADICRPAEARQRPR